MIFGTLGFVLKVSVFYRALNELHHQKELSAKARPVESSTLALGLRVDPQKAHKKYSCASWD